MKKIAQVEFLFEVLQVLIGLLIAFGVTLICIVFIADNPGEAIYNFAVGPFTSKTRLSILMNRFIPYVLTGCGMCFVYSCGRFSLIGEGIINFAPLCATAVIFSTGAWVSSMPLVVNLTIIVVVCAVVGGLVSTVPAFGREKLGANEMVLSIIMNYMLLYISTFFLKRFLTDRGISHVASKAFPDNAFFQKIPGTPIHLGIVVSIIGYVVACLIFYRSRTGANIRICGANIKFASYAGISTTVTMFMAHILGGVYAGMAGAVDAFGSYSRYQYGVLTSIGMDGLLVAVLARKHPIFVPLAAFVLAYIRAAVTSVNTSTNIPIEFVNIMQAILIVFVAARQFLSKPKNAVIFRMSRNETAVKEAAN